MSSAAVAAISQLVATGSIDSELTGQAQITFWRYSHYKHTAFSMENQLLQFEAGGSQTGNGQKTSLRLHRSGDLVHKLYAVVDLPGLASVTELTAAEAQKTDAAQANQQAAGVCEVVFGSDDVAAYVQTDATKQGTSHGMAVCGAGGANKAPFYTAAVGQYLIQEATLLIGSQPIDRVYNHYLNIWTQLSQKPGKDLSEMIGRYSTPEVAAARSRFFQRLFVPLEFFHTRASGSALPIVSLQFHDVQVACTWNSIKKAICNMSPSVTYTDTDGTAVTKQFTTVVRPGQGSLNDSEYNNGCLTKFGYGSADAKSVGAEVSDSDVTVQLEAQYIYLDLQERQRFSKGSFQILISEVQTMSTPTQITNETQQLNLTFNHAVIQLLFAVVQKKHEDSNDHFNYDGVVEKTTGIAQNPIKEVDLRLNNQQRFYPTNGNYFRTVQCHQHQTNVPADHIMTYSFALHPESENPSGSANFSRVDNAQLTLKFDKAMWSDNSAHGGDDDSSNSIKVLVYARSWNILRVTLGLAGKAFAN
ncbi:MAG: hypothetical protein CL902_00585 [Dehalococcoidia bacterium]|nr:hypothetical protein [Dehalococcoidia bacterium]